MGLYYVLHIAKLRNKNALQRLLPALGECFVHFFRLVHPHCAKEWYIPAIHQQTLQLIWQPWVHMERRVVVVDSSTLYILFLFYFMVLLLQLNFSTGLIKLVLILHTQLLLNSLKYGQNQWLHWFQHPLENDYKNSHNNNFSICGSILNRNVGFTLLLSLMHKEMKHLLSEEF